MGIVAWQGWRLELPAGWDPVKLEGDYDRGQALFADLEQPRLGVRWRKAAKRKFDADAWAQQALRDEVGQLAAREARPLAPQTEAEQWRAGRLYIEREPPGRDVWVGYSGRSQRVLEVVYYLKRSEHPLSEQVLPTLQDLPLDQPVPWAVFELSCRVPPGLPLLSQRLNAGDLSLSFGDPRRQVTVRQVAVAKLALKRMGLEKWLGQFLRARQRQYRPVGVLVDAQLPVGARTLQGVSRRSRRRRRFAWVRWIAPQFVSYALHDEQRDRLVLIDATDEDLARQVVQTIGWARVDEDEA